MTIPEHAVAVALRLATRDGAPPVSDDDARRAFFRRVAEQTAFDLGSTVVVGVKKTSNAAPQCADCVAWFEADGLHAADLQDGTTGAIRIVGTFHRPSDVFISVTPTDHLRTGGGAGGGTGGGGGGGSELVALLAPLVEDVDRIATGLAGIEQGVQALAARLEQLEKNGLRLRVR